MNNLVEDVQTKASTSIDLLRLVDGTLSHYKSENAMATARLDLLSHDFRVLEETTQKLYKENASLTNMNKEYKLDKDNIQADLQTMQKKLVGYTSEKTRLANSNEELNREIEDFNNKIENLQNQLTTLTKRNNELAVIITVSENKIMDLEKD